MSFPRKILQLARFFSSVDRATRDVEHRMLKICNECCLKSTSPVARQEWVTRSIQRRRLPKVVASTEFGRFLGSNSSIHSGIDLRHVASLVPLGNAPNTRFTQMLMKKRLTAIREFNLGW
jgi:hypothetical protein